MRILILGGDGYLGWPTAMRFSSRGHDVRLVDNYLRRLAHREAGTDSPVPILPNLPERASAWRDLPGRDIESTEGDLCDWDLTASGFRALRLGAAVHCGVRPSARYS